MNININKNFVAGLIIVATMLLPNVLSSEWSISDRVYDYTLGAQYNVFNSGDTYFTSGNYKGYIINAEETDSVDLYELTNSYSTYLLAMEYWNNKYYFSSLFGLFEFNPKNGEWRNYNTQNSDLPTNGLTILESGDDGLFIASHSLSMIIFKDGNFETIPVSSPHENLPHSSSSLNIVFYKGAYYYFSVLNNISRYNSDTTEVVLKKEEIYKEPDNSSTAKAAAGFIEHNGLLYFITGENVMYSFDGDTITVNEKASEFLQTNDSIRVMGFQFNKNNEPVMMLAKIENNMVVHTYLTKMVNGEYQLYDYMTDLGVDEISTSISKNDSGYIYFTSRNRFVTDGPLPSKVDAVHEGIKSVSPVVFPNPVSTFLNIEVNEFAENHVNWRLSIFDMNGKLVQESKQDLMQIVTSGESCICNVNVSALQKGVYFFDLDTGNQKKNGVFIKE